MSADEEGKVHPTTISTIPAPPTDPSLPAVPLSDDGSNLVRIRGLPYQATLSDIRDFFKDLIIVDKDVEDSSIDGVYMALATNGRPSGEAYIQFATSQARDAALKKHQQHMGTRYIEVFTSSREERAKAIQRAKLGHEDVIKPVSNTSFVVRLRGLPYSATEKDLRTFLTGINIVGLHILRDSQGRVTGEAYAEVATEQEQRAALAYDKRRLGSRYVEVIPATIQEMLIQSEKLARGHDDRHHYRDRDRDRYDSRNRDRSPGRHRYDERSHYGSYHEYGHYGSYPMHTPGPAYPSHTQPGPAYPQGYPPYGAPSYGGPSSYDPYAGYGRGGGGAFRGGAVGGAAPIGERPRGPQLYVWMRGLPWNATDVDVTEFFATVNVTPARIICVPGEGQAHVEFASESDTDTAMTRHKSNMGRRYVELFRVSYEKFQEAATAASSHGAHGGGAATAAYPGHHAHAHSHAHAPPQHAPYPSHPPHYPYY